MPDIEGVPYETAGTALDVATAQALAARHREAAAAGVRAETALPGMVAATSAAQARADAAYALADAAATPAMVDQKVSTATTGLVTEAALADALDGFSGGGVESVSGTVTLDATGEPIREFFTTGQTSFVANGTSVSIGAGVAVVWRRTAQGSWGYQVVPDEWTTPTPTPDTTAPVAGTLAVAVTDVKADLTVSGASDDRGVVSYAFSKDNGTTWTTYQNAASYTFTGLSASTSYQFRHRVKDAAGNVTTGTTVSKTTAETPPWGSVYADDFTAPDGTALVGRAVPTAPTPTIYQQVATSSPVLSGGQLPGTALVGMRPGNNPYFFAGAMIDVEASNKVEYTVAWKSGASHPEGVVLIYGGTDSTHMHALRIAGTTSQNWDTITGNVNTTGGSVNLSSAFGTGPEYNQPHTMTATITRNGTSATLDVVVDGVEKMTGYALPTLTHTGTLMGVGVSVPTTVSTTTAYVDSWSVTAA